MSKLLYICHDTELHNRNAGIAATGLAASSGDVTAEHSTSFKGDGGPIEGCLYPSRAVAFAETDHFVILLPTSNKPINFVRIAYELAEYLGVCARHNRQHDVLVLHHEKTKFEPLAPYLPADSVIVSSSETAVFTAMLSRVYGRTPDSQENMAANLKRALGKEPNVKRDVSISVTLSLSSANWKKLQETGVLDDQVVIGGDQWTQVFNLPAAQGGTSWGQAKYLLHDPDTTQLLLATELLRSSSDSAGFIPIPLVLKQQSGFATFLALRKYELYTDLLDDPKDNQTDGTNQEQHVFTFAAAHWPLLFSSGDLSHLATSYHLLVVGQLVRFVLVEEDGSELERLAAASRIPGSAGSIARDIPVLRNAIGRHMLLIQGECHRRRMWNRIAGITGMVRSAYPDLPERDAGRVIARLSSVMEGEWEDASRALMQHLNDAAAGDLTALPKALEHHARIVSMNSDYLRISTGCYRNLRKVNLKLSETLADLERIF